MPSFKSAGKSREDLALVAQLAGLVSAEEAAALSRAELVRIIEKENRRAASVEREKAVSQDGVEPAQAESLPDETAKRKRRIAKPKPFIEATGVIEQTPPASDPVATAGTAPESQMPQPAVADAAPDAAAPKLKKPIGRPRKKTAAPVVNTGTQSPSAAVKKAAPAAVQPVPASREPAPARRIRKMIIQSDRNETADADASQMKMDILMEQPAAYPGEINRLEPPEAPGLTSDKTEPPLPDQSPEAAEAASEKPLESAQDAPHRIMPHQFLKTAQPERRRTVRNITPAVPADSPAPPPTPRYGQTRVRTGRIPGARPAVRPTDAELQRPSDYPDSEESALLQESSQPEDRAAAGDTAVPAPAQTVAETEAAKALPPQIETGDLQSGVLEIMPDGYGFLRKENYLQGTKDIYVPPQYIRRFGLRPGDYVTGLVKLQRESDRFQALLYIKEVNGQMPEKMLRRPHFDRLTPIYPDNRFILETVRTELSTRIIDLVAPIGKGQRGMIVSPPKAGKTILLQKIANAISTNNPEVKLIVLLIDERPEEVTDMQRSINGEVVYSTFDKTPENHTKVTELVLERAMRLVELKQDVVILLDSMTRLARAYNLSINPTGRTLSGGLDPGALYGPKRFFGAARNIENGGSLTIIATSLIETGSRMDEVIFEEFKGTGNMEVYLDRKLSEKRIFPAIDINKSGTRREELLMNSKELDAVWTIRKAFSQLDTSAVTEAIINLLLKTKNNEHFISSINVSFNDKNVFDAMRGSTKPQDQQQQARIGAGAAGGNGYGYNTTGSASNYRRPTGYDDD